jgi:hypothetical protein
MHHINNRFLRTKKIILWKRKFVVSWYINDLIDGFMVIKQYKWVVKGFNRKKRSETKLQPSFVQRWCKWWHTCGYGWVGEMLWSCEQKR